VPSPDRNFPAGMARIALELAQANLAKCSSEIPSPAPSHTGVAHVHPRASWLGASSGGVVVLRRGFSPTEHSTKSNCQSDELPGRGSHPEVRAAGRSAAARLHAGG